VARAARPRSGRPGGHDGAVPVLARQRFDLARLRRRRHPVAVCPRARRSDRGVARWPGLHDRGHLRRREPRRAGRHRVRGPPRRALRTADHDLGRPASRWLGHRDAPPPARAGPRRAAHRRRRDRHGPRAPARHADLPRPRGARHPVRRAGPRARSPAGGGLPRSPRRAIRGPLPGAHVPPALGGDRSQPLRDGSRHAARAARARHRRGSGGRRTGRSGVSVRAPARALSRAPGGRRHVLAVEARLRVRPRRVPRRSGPARRTPARRARVRGGGTARALRGRRRAADPRDPDRHGRLRHGRQRRARAARSPGRRNGRALRGAVPRHADRRPRSGQNRARGWPPASRARPRRSSWSAIPRST